MSLQLEFEVWGSRVQGSMIRASVSCISVNIPGSVVPSVPTARSGVWERGCVVGSNESSREMSSCLRAAAIRQPAPAAGSIPTTRKVDIRLPGKGNSNSRGARPVYSF